ncbi:hypothetical protein OFN21_28420, partial [Escherichia coli]|nr:hypothetical protein [Escherichia coli]
NLLERPRTGPATKNRLILAVFCFLKESEFTCLSNIFYRLEFLILSRICLYLSEFGLISQVISLPNTAERAGVDNTLNKQ